MECLENESLENVMNTGPLELSLAAEIVEHILLGLKALHNAGIVHRDVKPANVLQDESGRFKLSDFGLSVVESDAKPTLEAATIRYVAPECISENPTCDFRSDLYSVGMVLYEGLLGADGFREAFPDLLPAAAFGAKWLGWLKDASREATPLHIVRPEIPAPVSQFAARLMSKDPEMRYASADAALVALVPLIGVRASRVQVHGTTDPSKRDKKPSRWTRSPVRYVAGAVAMVVLSISAVVFGAWLRGTPPARRATLVGNDGPSPVEARLLTRVVDERGTAIPDVGLVLRPGNFEGRSGADGTFGFEKLKPGTYELTATTRTGEIDVRKVTIESQRTVEETLTLEVDGAPSKPVSTPSQPPVVEPVQQLEGTLGVGKQHESPTRKLQSPPIAKPAAERGPKSAQANKVVLAQPATGELMAVSSPDNDLSRALAQRIKQRALRGLGSVRVSLTMSTRPSPFQGRGITGDYVATVQSGAVVKSFRGQVLGFAELTLRNEVVERAAAEITMHLGDQDRQGR